MTERMQLEKTIAHLESQRTTLGDAVINAALAPILERLKALELNVEQAHRIGERKNVTVIFADLSGFTSLAASQDAEIVRDMVISIFERLAPVVKKYEGTIEKFIGDEILAIFGAPVTHENDPERALRCALEMMEELRYYNIEYGNDLSMHMGVNTGPVVAGSIGCQSDASYGVVGDIVNLASRLEGASKGGQILVGADTYRLTASLFEFITMAPISVKGKVEPVVVYRLIRAKAGLGSAHGLESRGLFSPLVGRKREFDAIKSRIHALEKGQGSIVSVIGDAGLGKSRLMAELRRSSQGVQWLEGKTLSYGQSISYWPFREILRSYGEISDDDSELQVWQKLEDKVVTLFPDMALDILPYLASLLAVEVRGKYEERIKYLDGDALGTRIFLAMRLFMERLARSSPLVIVFEDLHWIDLSSTELLEYLLPLVREVPLLMVGVSRPDPDAASSYLQKICSQEYADCYTELRLSQLSQSESEQLVSNLVAIDVLPGRVREILTQKAEGNPFFIEEIIRNLLDIGAILRDPATGRWHITAKIETVHIPDTVEGVLMARIDRLDEEIKQTLRMSSVIGRSFLYRVLRAMDQADSALDTHLEYLQQVELIREKQIYPELEYIFKHALAQEATYESILLQKRRDLHGRVADAIETLFGERLDEFYSLLAYHYARAENWAKAQEYLFKSGDQAGRIAADAEALANYQQAMDACIRIFGEKWDPIQRAALEKRMGEVSYRRGEHQRAEEYFNKALAHMGHRLPETKWAVRRAILHELLQQTAHRIFPQYLVKKTSLEVPQPIKDELSIYLQLGWLHSTFDLMKTFLDGLRGLNRAEREGAVDETIWGLAGIGYALANMNLWGLARKYLQLASNLLPQTINARSHAMVPYMYSRYFRNSGQLSQALKSSRVCAQIYSDIGDIAEQGFSEANIANYLFYQGDFRSQLEICDRNLAMNRQLQNINIDCYFLQSIAKNGSVLGNWENVVEQFQHSIDLSKKIPNYQMYVESCACLAWHYTRTGNLDEALTCLEEAAAGIDKYRTQGFYNMQVYNTYSEACLIKTEQSIEAEKAKWLQKARYWLDRGLKQSKFTRTGFPEAMRLRGVYDWLSGKKVQALSWWEKSLQIAGDIGMRYYAALTYMEMGQRLGDTDYLAKAAGVFKELGAMPDLEKARAYYFKFAKVQPPF